MTRRYANPLAFKQALEQRLRDGALRKGYDLGRIRQLLVFDRFLARVFASLPNAVVLKGGLVLELRLSRARATKDIDLRLVGKPEQTLPQLQEAGRLDLGDELLFEVRPDPSHPVILDEGLAYEGRRFRGEARLADKLYGDPFGIDVAYAEPMHGSPETVAGSSLLAFAGIAPARFRVYPLETHIAEKLHAYSRPRERTNSRVKDLPDIALLAGVRPIEAAELRTAIARTFTHRKTHPVPASLPEPPASWAPVYARMAEENELPWRNIEELLAMARRFVDPPLAGGGGRWSPAGWSWIE